MSNRQSEKKKKKKKTKKKKGVKRDCDERRRGEKALITTKAKQPLGCLVKSVP